MPAECLLFVLLLQVVDLFLQVLHSPLELLVMLLQYLFLPILRSRLFTNLAQFIEVNYCLAFQYLGFLQHHSQLFLELAIEGAVILVLTFHFSLLFCQNLDLCFNSLKLLKSIFQMAKLVCSKLDLLLHFKHRLIELIKHMLLLIHY